MQREKACQDRNPGCFPAINGWNAPPFLWEEAWSSHRGGKSSDWPQRCQLSRGVCACYPSPPNGSEVRIVPSMFVLPIQFSLVADLSKSHARRENAGEAIAEGALTGDGFRSARRATS